VGGASRRVGTALAQAGHQHVAGTGGNGEEWVIAPLAGVVMALCALLGQPVSLADGGVQIDGQRIISRSCPSVPGSGQHLPAHPIQLAHVPPPETPQEGAQGGWRLHLATDSVSRPAGAQRVGVVDAVATGQRRGHQGQHLVSRIRPARCISQVNTALHQLAQPQMMGQSGRKQQSRIGYQAVVVEGGADAVRGLKW